MIQITNYEASRIAQQLSQRMGMSIEDVVLQALRAEMQRPHLHTEIQQISLSTEEKMRKVKEIVTEFNHLPAKDSRTLQEIMDGMYDEYGLPR